MEGKRIKVKQYNELTEKVKKLDDKLRKNLLSKSSNCKKSLKNAKGIFQEINHLKQLRSKLWEIIRNDFFRDKRCMDRQRMRSNQKKTRKRICRMPKTCHLKHN